MADGASELAKAARAEAYSIPLDQINVADGKLFETDTHWPYFERLRKEAPVHYQKEHEFGPYWSITKYHDIMAVDTNHEAFTSEPSITIQEPAEDFQLPMFIAMDPPKHDEQRKTVSPAVAPNNLAAMEPVIRERAAGILDSLPIGERFDWVDKVSIELTTMTLATLFDFPWEDRRKLTYWSDLVTTPRDENEVGPNGEVLDETHWRGELFKMVDYFDTLWHERAKAPPRNDLISMLAHGESTKNMNTLEFMGNLILLIVGGNDTTRNTISGSIYALNQFQDQYDILRANPNLIPNMVSETIRWQTPLAHMRRNATRDVEMRGQTIKKGDKVIMWYVSGNRDEDVIERPNDYWIERPRVRQHLSFGFGIHRCVGNRLAELQLRIIWEEILKRFPRIDVVGEPRRLASNFVKGYLELPVVIPARI
jgi:cytochrome P450